MNPKPAGLPPLALVGRLRVYEIKRWDECRSCEVCADTCPESAISGGNISALECLGCRICGTNYLNRDLCPHYSAPSFRRSEHFQPSRERQA